jgi:hypothetical protein
LVNQYDGIDLPDSNYRILCLDSIPQHISLFDRYISHIRSESQFINQTLAQRIEQGIGRGIRGDSDWCIIVIIGSDLSNFFASDKRLTFLSHKTQEQIKIGYELADEMRGKVPLYSVIGD